MNIEKTINAPISESTARYRINTYFAQAGYQPLESQGRILSYKRGSKLGSWFPRNPSNLLSIATIEVQEKGGQTQIKAEFEIKVTFKDESNFTNVFWNQEIKDFEIAVLKDQYTPLKNKKLTQRTIIANLQSLGPAVLYILLWGILAAILTAIVIIIPGTDTWDPYLVAIAVMALAGAATIFLVRLWKRRRQDRSNNNLL